MELGQWYGTWVGVALGKRPKKVVDVLNILCWRMFKNVMVVFTIYATLPVTKASVERVFSGFRLLKIWLRSTMKDDRLTALCMMHLFYDEPVDLKALLAKWERTRPRHIRLDLGRDLPCWLHNQRALLASLVSSLLASRNRRDIKYIILI